MGQDEQPPFKTHHRVYFALKIAVLALALALGTKLMGTW
jgi:hypothetical protein